MTIQQWNDLQNPTGNFWIHDSQDDNGWFYWMGFLYGETNYPTPQDQVSTATSLLVESLQLPDLPGEWEYALTMTGEAFTQQTIDAELIDISDAAMQIFNVVLYEEERPLGGTITIDAAGNITVIGTIYTEGNLTPASFTRVNALSYSAQMPAGTNMDLINLNAEAPWRAEREGMTVRFTLLPVAQIGCPQQGTPGSVQAPNVWADSTGIEWCHVATEGQYSMLVSRHAHEPQTATNIPDAFIRWPEATNAGSTLDEGPQIRANVNTWWSNNASSQLRAAAVHSTLPIHRTYPGQVNPNLYQAMHDEDNISMPISGTNNGLPFFLSHADLNMRLTTRRGPTINSNGTAWEEDSALMTTFDNGSLAWWPLRDAGCTPPVYSASCSNAYLEGGFAGIGDASISAVGFQGRRLIRASLHANMSWGFRPGVWIRR